jgi:hypothetical protein
LFGLVLSLLHPATRLAASTPLIILILKSRMS